MELLRVFLSAATILLAVHTITAQTSHQQSRTEQPQISKEMSRKLLESIDYYKLLNNQTAYEEFFKQRSKNARGDTTVFSKPRTGAVLSRVDYSEQESPRGPSGQKGDFRIEDFERGNDVSAEVLPWANCEPSDSPVSIEKSTPLVYAVLPPCVRVKRCGGCCESDTLECVPTASHKRFVKVVEFIFEQEGNTGAYTKLARKDGVAEVDEHTSCDCQCKLQEEQCNPAIHTYDDYNCLCKCTDVSTEEKNSCPSGKSWDEDTCSCTCHQQITCGTGYIFNQNSCLCDAQVERSLTFVAVKAPLRQTVVESTPVEVTRAEMQVTTPDPCAHMRPRRNYIYEYINGSCRAKFQRTSSRKTTRGRTNLRNN